MRLRAPGSCSALRLCNAPATEREFMAFRTVLARPLALRNALGAAIRLVLRPTNDRLRPRTPERATLPRELGRANERDPAVLPLMPKPRDPRLKCATPPRPP